MLRTGPIALLTCLLVAACGIIVLGRVSAPPPRTLLPHSRQQGVAVAGGLTTPTLAVTSTPTTTPTVVVASPPVGVRPVATHVVAAGETLQSIAEHLYGNPNAWHQLYDANRTAIGPDPRRLRIGTRLAIPTPVT